VPRFRRRSRLFDAGFSAEPRFSRRRVRWPDPQHAEASVMRARGKGGVRAAIGLGLLALALPGCDDAPADGALDPDAIPRLEIVEELRLGVVEGSDAEAFGRIGLAASTEEGELWIFDGLPPRILRFSRDGRPLGTVGRAGEGPGEFSEVRGMLAVRGGGVVVLDDGVGRLTWFDGNGVVTRSGLVPEGAARGPVQQDDEGSVYLRARDYSDPNRGPGLASRPFVWLRMDEDFEVVERIPAPADDAETSAGVVFPTTYGIVAPGMTVTFNVLDRQGQVLWARSRAYRIFRGSAGSATPDTFAVVAARPVMKTPGEQEELEDRIRTSSAGSNAALSPEKPLLQALSVDQDGRLWVQLRAEAERLTDLPGFQWQERGLWDVWSPEGQALGRIELPPLHFWMMAEGDRFWVRTFGPVGEPQVVQYRIRWADVPDA
jgi:hypothetical protein